jgi:hypothetical protein
MRQRLRADRAQTRKRDVGRKLSLFQRYSRSPESAFLLLVNIDQSNVRVGVENKCARPVSAKSTQAIQYDLKGIALDVCKLFNNGIRKIAINVTNETQSQMEVIGL